MHVWLIEKFDPGGDVAYWWPGESFQTKREATDMAKRLRALGDKVRVRKYVPEKP